MKYFLDQEFIERHTRPFFGKSHHVIDLISIGIVGEDGSEFFRISSDYNYDDASDWVKENVIVPLYMKTCPGDLRNKFDADNFHKHFGRPNKEIMVDIILYVYRDVFSQWREWTAEFIEKSIKDGWDSKTPIEFYGYYADYDWVLFCSLFGTMMDLPKEFPMYCRDLKQTIDDYNEKNWFPGSVSYMEGTGVEVTLDMALERLKSLPDYPKQNDEHDALSDAKWIKQLYYFLNKL